MSSDLARPTVFGMAGIIDLRGDGGSLHRDLRDVIEGFQNNATTVSIVWQGDGIAAVTFQHSENALIRPGEYVHQIPEAGDYRGLLLGHFFGDDEATASDVPVPLRTSRAMISNYVDQGAKALAKLNGAWASAIWDKARRRAIFARDVVGAETLYVVAHTTRILFASDLRLLRALGGPSEIDEQAVAEFLHYLYVPAPRTIYRNVQAVLPGHILIVEQDAVRQQRFAPPRFVQGDKLSDQASVANALSEYLPRFEEALCSAVEDCLPKDGRLGLLLSGGKDSSALAIALSQIAPDRVICLTVGAQDSKVDESSDAVTLCRFLGLPHIVHTPTTREMRNGIQRFVASQDQPCGDTASLPLFLALDHLPEDIEMVWDGTGNDYYFGFVLPRGEQSYLRRVNLQTAMPKPLRSALLLMMRLGPPRFRGTAAEWSKPIEESFVSWDGWTAHELEALYGEAISFADTELWRVMRAHPALEWITLETEVLGGVWEPHAAFRKGALAVQAHGKAGRYPFIDNRLASLVHTLPQELQFEGYTNKTLLRAYLAKYLPDDLLRKPKGYFVFDPSLVLSQSDAGWLHTLRQKDLLRALPSWSDRAIAAVLRRYEKEPSQLVDKAYALAVMATWIALRDGKLSEPTW